MSDIEFTIAGGDLPVGTDVSSGILSGTVSWENLFNAPLWVTPSGNLAVFKEDDMVPVTGLGSLPPLEITMQEGSEFARFSIVNANVGLESRGLPWGLLLDAKTGIISGKVSPLLEFDAPSFLEEEAPIWNTASGLLGNFGEKQSVAISLVLSPQPGQVMQKFSIKRGGLPWGLTLNKQGLITGTTAPTVYALDTADDAPSNAPQWVNAPGLIAIPIAGDFMSVLFRANPVSPATSIVKYTLLNAVSSGSGLPWGTTLVPSTGIMQGRVQRPLAPLISEAFVWPNGPLWNTPEGSLGDVGEQRAVDVTLAAVPQLGTLKSYTISRGALPWGITLNIRTGKLSGNTAVLNPGTEPQEPILPPPVFNAPLLVSGTPKVAGSGTNLGTFAPGSAVQFDLKATLGDSARTMSKYTISNATGSAIPLGLTYNTRTGRLGGTIRNGILGKSTFTVIAIDSAGAYATQTFTITVG